MNLGQLEATKLLVSYGSEHDHVDDNGQTPLYYAIKSERMDSLKYLLELGAKVNITDKRGQTPVNFAYRHQKQNLIKVLVDYGAQPPMKPKPRPTPVPVATGRPSQLNQRKIPKEYVLQILDNGKYRPITATEFDLLKREQPEIAKYFQDESEIEKMEIPPIDESVAIYYHWEKVSARMM